MIFDYETLKNAFANYSNINQKISLECNKGSFFRIKKGLYTDNLDEDVLVIANVCVEPSYISFEYALAFYGLIPEYVSTITSSIFNKKNNKVYDVNDYRLEYRSIPDEVFSYGILFKKNEKGVRYKIASKEKALCDTLYLKYPVRNMKDLKIMLFEDLRIDEDEFMGLDFEFILSIVNKYHSNTLTTLGHYIRRLKCDFNY